MSCERGRTMTFLNSDFFRCAIAFLLLVALGLALLFASGLLPQERIEENYLLSIDEIEREWSDSNILRSTWGSYKLDDWSEVVILSLSTYMDTASHPESVLKNSYPLEDNFTIQDARNTVANHEEADVFYTRYWHGFRTYVRALLSVMDYGTMRTLIMWAFFLLMAASALMLAFQTRSVWPPMLFTAALLFVNPVVASALFQYSICFVITFLGMLFVPRWLARPRRAIMGFFILGMATQYFDFYTTPLLTFGLPLLALSICQCYAKEPPSAKALLLQTLKLFGVWFCAYILMWITKLTLTTVFTSENAFASAWGSAVVRLGIEKSPDLLFRYNKIAAILSAFKHLFDRPMLVIFLVVCAVAVLFMALFRTNRASYARGAVLLIIAAFPILWTLVATQPMYMHAHFQYRILAVTMLGGMYFWLLGVDRSRLPDIRV